MLLVQSPGYSGSRVPWIMGYRNEESALERKKMEGG